MKHVIFEDRLGSALPDFIFSAIKEIEAALMRCMPMNTVDISENKVMLDIARKNCQLMADLIDNFNKAHDHKLKPAQQDRAAGLCFQIVNHMSPEGSNNDNNN